MPAQNPQVLAYQYEKVMDKIELLFQQDHTLFDLIEKRADVEEISSREMRVPLDLLAGGKGRQVNPDGGDAGRGSAIVADKALVTTVAWAWALEFTKLFEVATDNKEKAVEPAAKHNIAKAADQFRAFLESLMNTDGSGAVDTITAVSGVILTVNNANQFYDNQNLQVVSADGLTNRGTIEVFSTDANSKQIYLTAPPPAGTVATDKLVIEGASGAPASSMLGIEYHHQDTNVGTWLQLNRAAYPGKLKTPHVAANGFPITQQMPRLAMARMKNALGVNTPNVDDLRWQMNQDMLAQWENVGLVVSTIIQNQLGGNMSEDMLKKEAPSTMAGRPILLSINAQLQRIDGICLKKWGWAETKSIGPLEFGGQTIFPTYGQSGGVEFNSLTYMWLMRQLFMENPRAGVFMDGFPLTSGY